MSKYCLNLNIFDEIDTEEKAYWIGFIWCDGYNAVRNRRNRKTYEFKLSLSEIDVDHLEKFKYFLSSNHPIKIYSNNRNTSFSTKNNEARILIANTKFGGMLDEKYGLIPNRYDANKVINSIPTSLIRHFIRGVLDADGSFSKYNTKGKTKELTKYTIGFTTYFELIDYINKTLYESNISHSKINKYGIRHKDRDGQCRELKYSGRINVKNILDWLYKDANIYLERKYIKYLEMFK